jgi:hypothetical protein
MKELLKRLQISLIWRDGDRFFDEPEGMFLRGAASSPPLRR